MVWIHLSLRVHFHKDNILVNFWTVLVVLRKMSWVFLIYMVGIDNWFSINYLDLSQHWLRQCLVAWRHQVITWTNVDLSSIGCYGPFLVKLFLDEYHNGTQLRTIWQETLKTSIQKGDLENYTLKNFFHTSQGPMSSGRHYSNDRAYSRFAPSQWEMSLQSNAVSHWLGANL